MKLGAYEIVKKIQDAGFVAYFAGGCVRDMILGKVPKDFDIATNAKIEEIEALFEMKQIVREYEDGSSCDLNTKTIAVGKAFGVVQVHHDGHIYEIATFRKDFEYTDGRRPARIEFSEPEFDAQRRDFTINGLFFDPIKDCLIDFVDGEKDLNEGLIRFIGNPEERILEDHLRILRAIRFKNELGFQYEPETYKSLKKLSGLVIEKVSFERIRDEFIKIVLCERADQAFEEMFELGILDKILPEMSEMKGIPQPRQYHQEGDVWNHAMLSLKSLGAEGSLRQRIAVLMHDIGKVKTFSVEERIRFDKHAENSAKMVNEVLGRLKFPKKFVDEIAFLVGHHMMMGALIEMPDSRKSYWYHHDLMPDLLVLFKADIAGTVPSDFSLYQEIENQYFEYLKRIPERPKPLLNGNEIMELLGIEPGPKIKEIIDLLTSEQLERKVLNKQQAIDWVKKFVI